MYASVTSTASGGNGGRSCLGCPGWPPIFRLLCDPIGGDLGGLTMSLEGGFDDVVEFFRAVASSLYRWLIRCACCSMRLSNSAFRASKRRMTASQSRRDGAFLRRFLMDYSSESTRKTCHSAFGAVNGYPNLNGSTRPSSGERTTTPAKGVISFGRTRPRGK